MRRRVLLYCIAVFLLIACVAVLWVARLCRTPGFAQGSIVGRWLRCGRPTARTPLAVLSNMPLGTVVLVEGHVTALRAPRPGERAPWRLLLEDESGSMPMIFWESAYSNLHDRAALVRGCRVRAVATVRLYREQQELVLASGSDLTILPDAGDAGGTLPTPVTAQAVSLQQLDAGMTGRVVSVTGRVEAYHDPAHNSSAPHRMVLADGSQSVTVVFWNSVADWLPDDVSDWEGRIVNVEGRVQLYHDEIQLKVDRASQIAVLSPVDVTVSMIGRVVTVRGVLGEPVSLRGGVIYPLGGGGRTIEMLLWDRLVPGSTRDALQSGVQVTVTGEVMEYRGALQVMPASALAVRVEPR